MRVQSHYVHAFISALWDTNEAAALVSPNDPASAAILSEVDGQVAGYVHSFMDDLMRS